MTIELRDIEETESAATVYQVTDANKPAFDCVNAVKRHHVENNECQYHDLTARKVGENQRMGHFVVVVVDWTELQDNA